MTENFKVALKNVLLTIVTKQNIKIKIFTYLFLITKASKR
jgi:hypothetical protein